MKIKSDFAILDVKAGRKALSNYFKLKRPATKREGFGGRSVNPPLKVMIEAEITDQWSDDDGVSIEFSMAVKKVTFVEVKK